MHVAKVSKKYGTASGPRESVSFLLRRTYRDGGKVKHETLANLSPLPAAAIEAVRASLAGQALVVAGEGLEVTRSLPHGHVAAVHAARPRSGRQGLGAGAVRRTIWAAGKDPGLAPGGLWVGGRGARQCRCPGGGASREGCRSSLRHPGWGEHDGVRGARSAGSIRRGDHA